MLVSKIKDNKYFVPPITCKCPFWRLEDFFKAFGRKWAEYDSPRCNGLEQVSHSERRTSSINDIKKLLRLCSAMIKVIFWFWNKSQMTLFLCHQRVLVYKIREEPAMPIASASHCRVASCHNCPSLLSGNQGYRTLSRHFLGNWSQSFKC